MYVCMYECSAFDDLRSQHPMSPDNVHVLKISEYSTCVATEQYLLLLL